ncbi:UNVERIFIED_CONTAM: hypothetical protein PYX00_006819 [Menopon gallinae]|uniref:Laminin EGF-like domain-containing protein n=1 Tax=Menopon gallinae TaxID=328185 RepID=A0AAW2HYH0_9NEOP
MKYSGKLWAKGTEITYWILRVLEDGDYDLNLDTLELYFCRRNTLPFDIVLSCECDADGFASEECYKVSGQCPCRERYTGRKCDRCEVGFGNVSANCEKCECGIGTKGGTCDSVSGECDCQEGAAPPKCDACEDLHYGLSAEGCTECGNNGLIGGVEAGLEVCFCQRKGRRQKPFAKPSVSGIVRRCRVTHEKPPIYGIARCLPRRDVSPIESYRQGRDLGEDGIDETSSGASFFIGIARHATALPE